MENAELSAGWRDGVAWGPPVAISYSGGTSSEWLVEAVIRGVLPRPPRCAVFFADTGGEHEWTYRHVAEVEARCAAAGLPFYRERKEGPALAEHIIAGATANVVTKKLRIDQPPFFIDKGDHLPPDKRKGRVQQRCSREFKVAVLRRAQRRWARNWYRRPKISVWVGFAMDEAHRAQRMIQALDVKWARPDFPAILARKTRADQRRDLIEWTGRAPRFSMCVFCPHKTPGRWGATDGADADKAILVDEAIRNVEALGLDDGPAYLSDRLVPVAQLVRHPERFAAEEADPAACSTAGACFL